MNPPSAIANAMGRDRKPFTYTPGGLDLSEIKSEKMAKRLMRNAMNQGVPELPSPTTQHISTPTTPVAVPNFNCLPVQVFPSFQLPSNPKSLLRTRSNPAQPKDIPEQNETRQYRQSLQLNEWETPQENNINNVAVNTRPVSMYSTMPSQIIERLKNLETSQPSINNVPKIEVNEENNRTSSTIDLIKNEDLVDTNKNKDSPYDDIYKHSDLCFANTQNSISGMEDEQSSVNVVKTQSKKTEKRTETHKKSQNGDSAETNDAESKDSEENDAELTVQLPSKKIGTKTETKVEVLKKTLADGTVEEITTTTTTKTSPDGKKEITTKTEKKIFPKETEEEEEYEEEEQHEEQQQEDSVVTVEDVTENGNTTAESKETSSDNNTNSKSIIVKNTEHSESTKTTTKKVVVFEDTKKETEEKEYESEEDAKEDTQETEIEELEETETEEPEENINVKENIVQQTKETMEEKNEDINEVTLPKETLQKEEEEEEEEVDEELEEEEEYEETEETQTETKSQENETILSEETEVTKTETETTKDEVKEVSTETTESEKKKETAEETKEVIKETTNDENKDQSTSAPTPKSRDIPILFDKVEDIEIKPISGSGGLFTKTTTEKTEIITNKNAPLLNGPTSLQTEMQRIENITITNKSTRTLDQAYEQLTQQGNPPMKTYFAPGRDRVSISPSKVYQPTYTPEPTTERRHSLLLERLSMERQPPAQEQHQNYQIYDNQTIRQWSQEPQSEVLSMPNVKPSAITKNQQWYQQTKKENEIYNNVSTNTSSSQSWNQPPQQSYQAPVQPPQQPQYQPPQQPQYQPPQQPQYQPPQQPQYQPQNYYESTPQPEPQYQYQPPKQTSYTDNYAQNYSNNTKNTLQHQHSFPSYVPKQTTWYNDEDAYSKNSQQTNQFSYQNNFIDNTQKTQQYSSGYVPPPWEQDSSYATAENTTTTFYQTIPPNDTFKTTPTSTWNSNSSTPANKFSKPAPLAYVPPAPNQSFVKPVKSEQTKQTGRKTYYSEYERRYISVPDNIYVPGSNKLQAQPNPSPQYYYDNNEPEEKSEHAWRKELREFTEKSSTQYQSEQSDIKPPWEEEKHIKTQNSGYNPQPTWSQTLKPRSSYERSFESSEYVSSEWPKNTNTIGRNRPLSYIQSNNEPQHQERQRGVSVDRYNSNIYQSPVLGEHPPVQSHTLTPTSPGSVPHSRNYHNPHVPAYHSRASAEPREQSSHVGTRVWADSRESPVQSRSFKYLQWITGTDD